MNTGGFLADILEGVEFAGATDSMQCTPSEQLIFYKYCLNALKQVLKEYQPVAAAASPKPSLNRPSSSFQGGTPAKRKR